MKIYKKDFKYFNHYRIPSNLQFIMLPAHCQGDNHMTFKLYFLSVHVQVACCVLRHKII